MKNETKNTITIGVVMEDAYTDFAKDILHSIAHAILGRNDLRLVVVCGRQDNSEDPTDRVHRYKTVYNSIYKLNGKCRFDGLIFTIPDFTGVKRELYEHIPKVYIASDKTDEITVNYDNEMGIREALDYLIKIKGFTRICMIGGREDSADARRRKAIFQKCLEDNGIPFSESL